MGPRAGVLAGCGHAATSHARHRMVLGVALGESKEVGVSEGAVAVTVVGQSDA